MFDVHTRDGCHPNPPHAYSTAIHGALGVAFTIGALILFICTASTASAVLVGPSISSKREDLGLAASRQK